MNVPRMRISMPSERGLLAAFRAGQLVVGPHGERLARALEERSGFRRAVLTSNGFAALHLALSKLLPRGGDVLVPAVSSCYAVLHAVTAAGAGARFADVDAVGQLAPDGVTRALAADTTAPTAVVLATPLFGLPPAPLRSAIAGRPLVEDAAQGLTRVLEHKPEADCVIGSLYPTKLVNGIDGGVVLTDSDELADAIADAVYYDHQAAPDGAQRFNYRLANLHAAVALDALDGLSAWTRRLEDLARRYDALLADVPDVRPLGTDTRDRTLSRYVLSFADPPRASAFLSAMRTRGVECGREFVPLVDTALLDRFPVAAALLESTVSLPFYPNLNDAEIEHVIASARACLAERA